MEDFQKQIDQLQEQIDDLRDQRLRQMDIIPGSVKNRHMGEPNTYVFSGLAASRPASGSKLTSTGLGCTMYWAYDTGVLSIWNGTAWLSETLT